MGSFLSKAAGFFGGKTADKLSGRTDYLEALTAAGAYMASCDGNVDDSELDKLMKSITAIPAVATAYGENVISQKIDAMLKRAGGGRMGRRGLMKEIEDLANAEYDLRESVLLVALDVADDGGIGDQERQAAIDIGKALGIDATKLI